jgi:hypothetical protein
MRRKAMANVTSISLSNLKTYGNWKRAPLSALLQARATSDGTALVGLRCEIGVSGAAPRPCLLVLDGERRGELLQENEISALVLDVSSLLEVRVVDFSLLPMSKDYFDSIGLVCEHNAGSGHFLVRAKLGSHRIFVWLSDPSGGSPMGTAITDAPPDLFVIGLTETFEIAARSSWLKAAACSG